MVEIAEDSSEAEYVVEVYEWAEKNGVVTLYSNGQLADSGKIVAGSLVPDENWLVDWSVIVAYNRFADEMI